MAETLYIGIDGGGSKTAVVLTDRDGTVLRQYTVGATNPNDVGLAEACKRLEGGVAELLKQAGASKSDVAALFAGIAGSSAADYAARMEARLQKLLPRAKVSVSHDGVNLLYSCFPDRDGICVICGTGSSCFIKRGAEVLRVGGYGLFDLNGSGYELGRHAIAHALRCTDGRDEAGALYRLVEQKAGGDPFERLGALIALPKDEIAKYAPLVIDASEQGDEYAQTILDGCMRYVAELIRTARKRCGETLPVGLGGGIFSSPYCVGRLAALLGDGELTLPDCAPCVGAARKARALCAPSA